LIHSLFDNRVTLEPVSHKYYHLDGNQYLSVSALLKMMGEKFEDTPAYAKATEETKAGWKKIGMDSAGHGTRIHEALELYNQTGQILIENKDWEQAIKSIIGEYKDYHRTYDEVCLYNEEYRVAGTTDKICMISNRKDGEVDLADFKTNNRNGIVFFSNYKKRLFAPFDHLQDCNYIKYSFQLSIYAYFFEQLTGRKVRQLYIHFVPADNMMNHRKIPVIYMKTDVKLLLESSKYKILSLLEDNQPAF
jgi:hypothetical protein